MIVIIVRWSRTLSNTIGSNFRPLNTPPSWLVDNTSKYTFHSFRNPMIWSGLTTSRWRRNSAAYASWFMRVQREERTHRTWHNHHLCFSFPVEDFYGLGAVVCIIYITKTQVNSPYGLTRGIFKDVRTEWAGIIVLSPPLMSHLEAEMWWNSQDGG